MQNVNDIQLERFKAIVEELKSSFFLFEKEKNCKEAIEWLNLRKVSHYVVCCNGKYKVKFDKSVVFDEWLWKYEKKSESQ